MASSRPFYSMPMAPALSPDGSTIAYFIAALGPNGDFWTIPAAGGAPTRLTHDFREGGWPVWTSDGGAIVVSSARAGSRTLWQIPVHGGEPSPLTTGAGEDDQPELSADGRQVAYTNVRNSYEPARPGSGQRRRAVTVPARHSNGLPDVLAGWHAHRVFRPSRLRRGDLHDQRRWLRSPTADRGRELNHMPRWDHTGQFVYFFQSHPTVSFRRVPALGGPSTEFRPWNWETSNSPYFDPTGRFLAYSDSVRPAYRKA